jgi:hypothetical protein
MFLSMLCVNAVQFNTKADIISPFHRVPKSLSKSVEFRGDDDSQLVGIYGTFGRVSCSLGLTFASIVTVPQTIGGSWGLESASMSVMSAECD